MSIYSKLSNQHKKLTETLYLNPKRKLYVMRCFKKNPVSGIHFCSNERVSFRDDLSTYAELNYLAKRGVAIFGRKWQEFTIAKKYKIAFALTTAVATLI